MTVLLDTNAYSARLRGDAAVADLVSFHAHFGAVEGLAWVDPSAT